MFGKLFLLPCPLDPLQETDLFLPKSVSLAVETLSGLIAESEKMGRKFLRRFLSHERMQSVQLALLNEHTSIEEEKRLLEPIERGEFWGMISDAGLTCLADPGARLVALAHEKGIEVKSFAGPSSLIFALQLSGFSGQNFAFHGYLPKEEALLKKKVQELESQSYKATQIWIEAPYRTEKMVEKCLSWLKNETRLCVAASLTLEGEKVCSFPVSSWKKKRPSFGKEPAVFLIYRE